MHHAASSSPPQPHTAHPTHTPHTRTHTIPTPPLTPPRNTGIPHSPPNQHVLLAHTSSTYPPAHPLHWPTRQQCLWHQPVAALRLRDVALCRLQGTPFLEAYQAYLTQVCQALLKWAEESLGGDGQDERVAPSSPVQALVQNTLHCSSTRIVLEFNQAQQASNCPLPRVLGSHTISAAPCLFTA